MVVLLKVGVGTLKTVFEEILKEEESCKYIETRIMICIVRMGQL